MSEELMTRRQEILDECFEDPRPARWEHDFETSEEFAFFEGVMKAKERLEDKIADLKQKYDKAIEALKGYADKERWHDHVEKVDSSDYVIYDSPLGDVNGYHLARKTLKELGESE